jgi:hypothetical protein
MQLIIGLFIVAYVLMVWCVCGLLRSGTRQLEIDYPFTEPPARLGHNGPNVTEGSQDEVDHHQV